MRPVRGFSPSGPDREGSGLGVGRSVAVFTGQLPDAPALITPHQLPGDVLLSNQQWVFPGHPRDVSFGESGSLIGWHPGWVTAGREEPGPVLLGPVCNLAASNVRAHPNTR